MRQVPMVTRHSAGWVRPPPLRLTLLVPVPSPPRSPSQGGVGRFVYGVAIVGAGVAESFLGHFTSTSTEIERADIALAIRALRINAETTPRRLNGNINAECEFRAAESRLSPLEFGVSRFCVNCMSSTTNSQEMISSSETYNKYLSLSKEKSLQYFYLKIKYDKFSL